MKDPRLYQAWLYWEGKWPAQLTSGVMYFDGLRIHISEFLSVGIPDQIGGTNG